jgi:outer membrane receptor for ferric coprogen and ferric-rhodotorulic acid
MSNTQLQRAAVVLAASALVPLAAYGQSSSAALPEVTVTAAPDVPNAPTEGAGSYTSDAPSTSATRLPLTLRETPQSISIVTRQRMEDQNLKSLDDVMTQSTGISRSQIGATDVGYVFYYSRGYQINNYQLDGMITSPAAMQGFTGLGTRDMAVYDQVTVVRGATGLLTGAGDPSASINLVRKRPTKDFQGHARRAAGIATVARPMSPCHSMTRAACVAALWRLRRAAARGWSASKAARPRCMAWWRPTSRPIPCCAAAWSTFV